MLSYRDLYLIKQKYENNEDVEDLLSDLKEVKSLLHSVVEAINEHQDEFYEYYFIDMNRIKEKYCDAYEIDEGYMIEYFRGRF